MGIGREGTTSEGTTSEGPTDEGSIAWGCALHRRQLVGIALWHLRRAASFRLQFQQERSPIARGRRNCTCAADGWWTKALAKARRQCGAASIPSGMHPVRLISRHEDARNLHGRGIRILARRDARGLHFGNPLPLLRVKLSLKDAERLRVMVRRAARAVVGDAIHRAHDR